jgi:hypothetical protein
LDECCTTDQTERQPAKSAYLSYFQWAREGGHT